ncbi:C-X-C motif chemokine 10-like [Suncus etruscus]|uniref:C-X-C motif chemokine 10-like n=1 Tax=Suncus etruscus TaxID=109475 RepID=UPI0021103890|nr:C-X-C motif chemokine 10-like [Suncus etruscus]
MNPRDIFIFCFIFMTLNGNKGIILSKTKRCTCIKMSNQTINPKSLEKLEVIPESRFCPQVEIIATMKKTGEKRCLDPESKNIKNLLKALSKKRSKRAHQQQRKA